MKERERERERKKERETKERERERDKKERETRKRERVCVCVCVRVRACVCMCVYLPELIALQGVVEMNETFNCNCGYHEEHVTSQVTKRVQMVNLKYTPYMIETKKHTR